MLCIAGCTQMPNSPEPQEPQIELLPEPQVELLLKGEKRVFQNNDVIEFQLHNAGQDTIWLRICGPVRLNQLTTDGWRDWGPLCVWDGIVVSLPPKGIIEGKNGPIHSFVEELRGTCRYVADIYRKVALQERPHFERLPDVISETFVIRR